MDTFGIRNYSLSILFVLILVSISGLITIVGNHDDGEPLLPEIPVVSMVVVDEIDIEMEGVFDISIPTVYSPGPWTVFERY